MSEYTTKMTIINGVHHCRVLKNGVPLVEARVKSRDQIGPAFRDLLRTIDKLGGDAFTSASRARKFKEGNLQLSVKHIWLK